MFRVIRKIDRATMGYRTTLVGLAVLALIAGCSTRVEQTLGPQRQIDDSYPPRVSRLTMYRGKALYLSNPDQSVLLSRKGSRLIDVPFVDELNPTKGFLKALRILYPEDASEFDREIEPLVLYVDQKRGSLFYVVGTDLDGVTASVQDVKVLDMGRGIKSLGSVQDPVRWVYINTKLDLLVVGAEAGPIACVNLSTNRVTYSGILPGRAVRVAGVDDNGLPIVEVGPLEKSFVVMDFDGPKNCSILKDLIALDERCETLDITWYSMATTAYVDDPNRVLGDVGFLEKLMVINLNK